MSLPHSHDSQKGTNFHQDFQCLQGRCKDPMGMAAYGRAFLELFFPVK